MTYNDLLNAQNALSKLSDEELSVKEAVALSRLLKNLQKELEVFDEQKQKIFAECNIEQKEEGLVVPTEFAQKFKDDLEELLSTDLEGDYDKVRIKSDIQVSAAEVIAVEGFIDFESVE